MIITIARKEFRSLFISPSTWIVLGVLQFIFAWLFLARLDAYLQVQGQFSQIANPPGATQSVATPVLGTVTLILMILAPVFTMRLVAEERRNQTLPLLLAAPVTCTEIITGKFIGTFLFLSLIIAGCLAMLLTLGLGTPLDMGLLLTSTAGLVLLAATYTAAGLFFSTTTAQPVVAAVSSLIVLFGLWLLDYAGAGGQALKAFTPSHHFQNMNGGLLLGKDVIYFLVTIALFLLLAIRRLHCTRIYG